MSLILGLAALTLSHCLPVPATPKPAPPAAVSHAGEDHITALAAALYVANAAHTEACKMPDPAATMDDICDAWPDIAPEVLKVTETTPDQADVLRVAVADRLWAFTAVEHARAEAGDGYGYVFDMFVNALEKGADPDVVRTTALDVPRRLRELAEQAGGDE
ncbi:hypothetical protein QA942_10365 [Streptomyces sp. B21-106]|uniref:hypothetical protein n=1 Tax=Streptomyces sp. B21-106 TaxID=3039418 RepID=UPI002FEEF6B2